MRLNTVLLQTRVLTQMVGHILEDLVDEDGEYLPLCVGDHPTVFMGFQDIGGNHPVERFGGVAVGVDCEGSVFLEHDQPYRLG